MKVSKGEYKMLKNMVDDLMRAEEFINNIGVETRLGVTRDEFRPISDILTDVVTVSNNNPTIIKDAIGKRFTTTDESNEFIGRYNLDGIMSSMDRMTREQFIEKCNSNITLMQSIGELSFDDCADSLYEIYNKFCDVPAEGTKKIVEELNRLGIE